MLLQTEKFDIINKSKAVSFSNLLKSGFTPTLKHANQFLLFLSRARKFRSLIHFFHQMSSNQIEGNSKTHSIFTNALLKEHRYEEAADFLKTHMGKPLKCRQNRILDFIVQKICLKQKDPEKGLAILRDCLRIDGILPSSFTFCSLIFNFSSQGKMDRAIEVLEMMSDDRIKYPFDNFVCSSVISGFVKIGKPELAVGFFENAEKWGALRSNSVTYTALLSAYCRLGRFELVNGLVSRIEKDGLGFDAIFYSNLVHEYFKEGNFGEALRKHKEMLDRRIKLDTIGYTILIDGFSKEGNVEKAVGLLHKMRNDGLEPNLVTYTAIMLGFCRKGKIEEGFMVFKMVEDLGIEPDEFMYATLIDGVCRRSDFHRAFHLLEEMEKRGIKPSIVTYNTVINGLCKAGRTSEADEISKGIIGDVVTYSTLFHGFIEEENAVGILETRRRLEAAEVTMDVVMCNILIKALFMVGLFEDCCLIYKEMPEMGIVADSVTYCTMIDGYCKAGRIDEALEIFDEFRRTSIFSAACYNCIIHGLCREHMVGMAIEVFVELYAGGLIPDVGMYKMLFKEIIDEYGVVEILNVINRIQSWRPAIFEKICNDAICFLCERGFFEAACDVYMVLMRKGLAVISSSYYSILEALIYDSKDWLTRPILNNFVKKCSLDEPRASRILIDYMCMKDVNVALKYFEMAKKNTWSVPFSVNVLEKLTKSGRVLDAYKLAMKAKDNLPLMDVVDFSILVDGLCKGGHIKKALNVCYFARKNGVSLNIVTYNAVINGLCCQGCLVEALRLFDSLTKIDIAPSEITYAILIDALSKSGYLLDAKKLCEKMRIDGLELNARIYNSLVNEYCKLGSMADAWELLRDMEIKGLKPDEFTVSALIYGYCQKGDMEGALGFYFEFKSKGMLPDFLGFLYLVRGLCAKGRMEESQSILREMLQTQSVVDLLNKVDNDVKLEPVQSFLVFLCEKGSIHEAITILDEVGSMFFPIGRRSCAYHETKKGKELHEEISLDTVESIPEKYTSQNEKEFESCHVEKSESVVTNYSTLDRTSLLNNFDSYYDFIAYLCSTGDVAEANKVAKMICGFDRG